MDLLLLDGDNVFRRYWHANPHSALTSWRDLLITYQRRLSVPRCHVVVVFDGEDTREHGVAGYKAQRKEPDPQLVQDLLEAERTARSMCHVIKQDGTEGDQVMAGVVSWSRKQGLKTWLTSSDKDMLQLVVDKDPAVVVIRPMTGGYQHYGEDTVNRVFGVRPDQIASFLTLVGDSSDNLKGVRGIGHKGALYLLSKFRNLADIYSRLDQVELKYRLLLEDSQELVVPTYRLVKLAHPDVPIALREPSARNRLFRHLS